VVVVHHVKALTPIEYVTLARLSYHNNPMPMPSGRRERGLTPSFSEAYKDSYCRDVIFDVA
jgi:hypothetical protein